MLAWVSQCACTHNPTYLFVHDSCSSEQSYCRWSGAHSINVAHGRTFRRILEKLFVSGGECGAMAVAFILFFKTRRKSRSSAVVVSKSVIETFFLLVVEYDHGYARVVLPPSVHYSRLTAQRPPMLASTYRRQDVHEEHSIVINYLVIEPKIYFPNQRTYRTDLLTLVQYQEWIYCRP